MQSRLSIAVILLLLLGSCSSTQEDAPDWQVVKAGNLYALELPPTFEKGYGMHDYATLQYHDLENSIFLLGIEDAKENLGEIKRRRLKIGGYFNFVEDIVLEQVEFYQREATQQCKLPGTLDYETRIRDYYVSHNPWAPFPLFYRIAVYESEEYFFQLVLWMPYDDHCDAYPVLERITKSFVLGEGAIGKPKIPTELTRQ